MILSEWEVLDINNGDKKIIAFRRTVTISKYGYESSAILVHKIPEKWGYKIRFISNYIENDSIVDRDLSSCDSWILGVAETKEIAMLYADLMAIELGYKIKKPLITADYPIY